MVNEELVDLIAEAIYRHLHEGKKVTAKDYYLLNDEEKSYYLAIAHEVMCVYDDFFDGELDDSDEDYDEEDDNYDSDDLAMLEDPDDDYEDHLDYTEM